MTVSGPLDGVRVLDLTSNVMGPFASLHLADMGADVWKVESGCGDTIRRVGPARNVGMSSNFLHLNRNKRSIVLDLKSEGGASVLRRMIAGADVFLYSMRPKAMRSLGFSYDDVREVNPRIVYAGAVGFGQSGPYADRPAYDDLIQAASGMAALQNRKVGSPEFVATPIADRVVGISTAMAVCAALYHRNVTGVGQEVQVPMFETFAQLVLGDHLWGHSFDPPIGDWGYARTMNPDRRPYRTKDGRYVAVSIYIDKHWRSFFQVAGRPDLADHPKFADVHARAENMPELLLLLSDIFTTRPADEWLADLAAADVPAIETNTPAGALDDPHLRQTGFSFVEEHPSEGRINSFGIPQTWSSCAPAVRHPAPRLGEHSVQLLREAGVSEGEIGTLLASGAVTDELGQRDVVSAR
ncbi:CaiB/BaiF CoA transferase family protein [Rhodococcus wratislaviensis]|uniref:CaiB/BaiF CoA transferase family protein n=1 Tax=Rhodococcus wratislaviensis TaxID=44752 RepID=UPI00366A514D